jgi:hypothetical protein
MNNLITHFIFTRFNDKWDSKKDIELANGKNINSEIWLKHRFELFKKYYIPSIKKQTVKNFKIILTGSIKTPKNILNYFKDNNLIFTENSHVEYLNNQNIKSKFLITARLDNDDFIADNFIEEIQKNTNINTPLLIDSKGIIFEKNQNQYYIFSYKNFNSHFLSVICNPEENIRHCHETGHQSMNTLFTNKIFIDKQLWGEVVHEYNYSNKIRGEKISSPPKNYSIFK